jgi:hypothetical protein
MNPRDREIDLEVLTPVVEEMDQAVQRLMQHAVNGVLEERGAHWLDDAMLAAATGAFCGLSRIVGLMPPELQAIFWQAVMNQASGIKTMQTKIFQSRLDGTLIRKVVPDA